MTLASGWPAAFFVTAMAMQCFGCAAAAEVVGEAREMALALVGAEGCRGDVLPRWLEACDVAERRLVS